MDSFLYDAACALTKHLIRKEIRDFDFNALTTQRLVSRNKSGLILYHSCCIARRRTIRILLQIIKDGLLSPLAQDCRGSWYLRTWHHTQLAEVCTKPIYFGLFIWRRLQNVVAIMCLGCTGWTINMEVALMLLVINVSSCSCNTRKIDILETTFPLR